MNARYLIAPATSYGGWFGDQKPSMTIIEEQDPIQFTGLLDARGNRILRQREPCGFVRFDQAND